MENKKRSRSLVEKVIVTSLAVAGIGAIFYGVPNLVFQKKIEEEPTKAIEIENNSLVKERKVLFTDIVRNEQTGKEYGVRYYDTSDGAGIESEHGYRIEPPPTARGFLRCYSAHQPSGLLETSLLREELKVRNFNRWSWDEKIIEEDSKDFDFYRNLHEKNHNLLRRAIEVQLGR